MFYNLWGLKFEQCSASNSAPWDHSGDGLVLTVQDVWCLGSNDLKIGLRWNCKLKVGMPTWCLGAERERERDKEREREAQEGYIELLRFLFSSLGSPRTSLMLYSIVKQITKASPDLRCYKLDSTSKQMSSKGLSTSIFIHHNYIYSLRFLTEFSRALSSKLFE